MYNYEKLAKLLCQFDESKLAEEERLKKIWKEKEKLIDKILRLYWNIFEAYCNSQTSESYFNDELIKIDTLVEYIEGKSGVSIDDIHDAKTSPFAEDFLIEIFNKLLSPNYNPKEIDMFEKRFHLCALWFFYKMMPVLSEKTFPLAVVMQLDLSMAKLVAICAQLITALQYTGKINDSQKKRIEKVREGKQKELYRGLILGAYKNISIDGKSKNKVANEIMDEIKSSSTSVPSTDTIKRRLKEAKLPPFY